MVLLDLQYVGKGQSGKRVWREFQRYEFESYTLVGKKTSKEGKADPKDVALLRRYQERFLYFSPLGWVLEIRTSPY